MKKLLLLTAAMAVVFAGGCGGAGDTSAFGFATLRVVNLAPGAGNVDFRYRETPFVSALPFSAATPEAGQPGQILDTGEGTLVADTFGANAVTVSRSVFLDSNRTYTAILGGRAGAGGTDGPQIIVTSDLTGTLSPAQSHFRLVHNAPVAAAVDVYLTTEAGNIDTATPTLSALPRYAVSSLLSFNSGATRIWVTRTGSKVPLHNAVYNLPGGTYGTMTMVNDGVNTGTVFWLHTAPLKDE